MEFSLDVWHAAKNLAKELREASSRRDTRPLAVWIDSIKNHFWWCAQNADGSKAHFMVSQDSRSFRTSLKLLPTYSLYSMYAGATVYGLKISVTPIALQQC